MPRLARNLSPTADPQNKHKKRRLSRPLGGDEYVADGIAEFCERNGISQSFFHKLKGQGLAPEIIRLGRRVLISREASRRWLAEREAKSAARTTASPKPEQAIAKRPVGRPRKVDMTATRIA